MRNGFGKKAVSSAAKQCSRCVRALFRPSGYAKDSRNVVSLLDSRRWFDHLLSIGVDLDTKVAIDRTKGFDGYTYANGPTLTRGAAPALR